MTHIPLKGEVYAFFFMKKNIVIVSIKTKLLEFVIRATIPEVD